MSGTDMAPKQPSTYRTQKSTSKEKSNTIKYGQETGEHVRHDWTDDEDSPFFSFAFFS